MASKADFSFTCFVVSLVTQINTMKLLKESVARARELIKHNLYICAMIFCLLLLVVVSVTKGYQIFSIMPNLFWKLLVIPSVKFYGIQRKTSIPPRSLFLGAVHNLLLPQLNIFILMPHRLIFFYFAFHLLLLICLRRFSIAHWESERERVHWYIKKSWIQRKINNKTRV